MSLRILKDPGKKLATINLACRIVMTQVLDFGGGGGFNQGQSMNFDFGDLDS